jgi:hypothetical protein
MVLRNTRAGAEAPGFGFEVQSSLRGYARRILAVVRAFTESDQSACVNVHRLLVFPLTTRFHGDGGTAAFASPGIHLQLRSSSACREFACSRNFQAVFGWPWIQRQRQGLLQLLPADGYRKKPRRWNPFSLEPNSPNYARQPASGRADNGRDVRVRPRCQRRSLPDNLASLYSSTVPTGNVFHGFAIFCASAIAKSQG